MIDLALALTLSTQLTLAEPEVPTVVPPPMALGFPCFNSAYPDLDCKRRLFGILIPPTPRSCDTGQSGGSQAD